MGAVEFAQWDQKQLEAFLNRVPDLDSVVANRRDLVAHFGYFLAEVVGIADITPRRLLSCYETAAIPAPINISDLMAKSGAFLRTNDGTKLHRATAARIRSTLRAEANYEMPVVASNPVAKGSGSGNTVVVVHGRDAALRNSMFDFLRSLGIHPIEWNEAVRDTGQGSPYVGDVVKALFRGARAVVVLLSPDEHVALRMDLRNGERDDEGFQPRPNVFIEAGMALSADEARTIIVRVGDVRSATNLLGRHLLTLDNSPEKRNALAQRLQAAGCVINTTGDDWLRSGNFTVKTDTPKPRRGK